MQIKNNGSEEAKSNDEIINKPIEYKIFEKVLKQSHFIFTALYKPIYAFKNIKTGNKEIELFTDETENDMILKFNNYVINPDYKKVNWSSNVDSFIEITQVLMNYQKKMKGIN